MYTQILVFLAAPGIKLQLQLALGKYAEHLIMLWEMYTWDSIRAYHFDPHQARILEGIDDSEGVTVPKLALGRWKKYYIRCSGIMQLACYFIVIY